MFRAWYRVEKRQVEGEKKKTKTQTGFILLQLHTMIDPNGIPHQTSICVSPPSHPHYHHHLPGPTPSPLLFYSPTKPPLPPPQDSPLPSASSYPCWEIYSTPTPGPPTNRPSTGAQTHSATGSRAFPTRATSRIGSGDSARTASRLCSRRGLM